MATLLRGTQIKSNEILESHLTANSVTTAKVANSAITEGKLADANVTTAKIADAAVNGSKIDDGAVSAIKLATDSVTTAKIEALAVTEAKLADGAVTTSKLGTGAVTNAKLAASAVSAAKLADDAVTTSKILDANITEGKLADGAVTTLKLAADAVDGSKIKDDSIAAEHIASGAIGTDALASGAITYDKLDAAVQSKLDNTISRVLNATTDPTSDTSAASWVAGTEAQVGSLWINTTTDEAFRCVDATPTAEIWVKTSVDSTELGDLAFMNQSALETAIQVSTISQVTGLQTALDLKAVDTTVVHLTGNETVAGVKTFTDGISGALTGNVTGQVSDLSNHISSLSLAEEDKYVDAAELATKFTSVEGDIATKAADNAVVHLAGSETITGSKQFSLLTSFTQGLKIGASGFIFSVQTTLREDGSAEGSAIASEAAIRTALDSLSSTLTAAIALKANDDAVVHLTGAETITGIKSFSDEARFNGGLAVSGSSIDSVQGAVRANGSTSNTAVVTETAVRAAIDAATTQLALSVRKDSTGDGTTNAFTYNQEGGSTSQLVVFRNGQMLRPSDDYTDNGSSVAFPSAPETGEYITILRWYTGN